MNINKMKKKVHPFAYYYTHQIQKSQKGKTSLSLLGMYAIHCLLEFPLQCKKTLRIKQNELFYHAFKSISRTA